MPDLSPSNSPIQLGVEGAVAWKRKALGLKQFAVLISEKHDLIIIVQTML
jgi:hypothetical protein